MSSSDDDGLCQPTDDNIPIIEPDFEIILDPTFLNTKVECVFNKLSATSGGFEGMIQKFDGEFPVAHLRFKTDATMTSNTRKAYTSPPSNYVIDITVNGNSASDASYQKRPTLLVAKTIIHEVMHAEMFRKLLSLSNTNGQINAATLESMLRNSDYPGMLDYYTRYGMSGLEHQQMAAHYRQSIADQLKEFDEANHSDQFYKDLAWEGLNHSSIVAWQNVTPQSERDRIDQTILNYISQNLNQPCQ